MDLFQNSFKCEDGHLKTKLNKSYGKNPVLRFDNSFTEYKLKINIDILITNTVCILPF